MNSELRFRLIEIARRKQVVTYGEIAPYFGLDMQNPQDRNTISYMLDEVSEYEFRNGRPLLSAVVILAHGNSPGEGFYTMATRIGRFNGNDDLFFFVEELNRVHEYWRQNNLRR